MKKMRFKKEYNLNPLSELKKRLSIASIATALISMYLVALISTLVHRLNPLNPLNLFEVFFGDKRTVLLWFFLSACIGIIVSYKTAKSWRLSLYADKLGKKRVFSFDYQPYGDAHWAEPFEYSRIAQIHNISDCKGIVLGQLTDDGSRCIDFYNPDRLNRHILCIGSSGSGKSFSLVLPYIMQSVKMRHSVIITDPKGELYQKTASYMEQQGYIVRRFDLITFSKSDGWDCLRFLRQCPISKIEENAEIFAKALVFNMDGNLTNKGDVYVRGSVALLKSLLLYVCLSPTLPDSKKNIATVLEILHLDNLDTIFSTQNEILKPAVNAYNSVKASSENLFGNIKTTLATGIQVLQVKELNDILCRNNISLTLPGDTPCAYYCRFSATDTTYRFVSSLFFSMLYMSLIDHADAETDKRLKVPVEFIMDEFASLGNIPDWTSKLANIRSYGLTALMIVQSLSQLDMNYGREGTVSIQSNCGTILNIGSNDTASNKWFEERMGITSIIISSKQFNDGINSTGTRLGSSSSESVGKDYLMSVSDIYTMHEDDMVILFQHCHPIFCHKVPITLFPEYAKCTLKNDSEVPDFYDIEKRKASLLAEKERILEYRNTHPNPTYYAKAEIQLEDSADYFSMRISGIILLAIKSSINTIKMKITKKSINNKDNETTQAFILYSDDDEPEQNEPVSDIFGSEINQPASSDTPVSPVKQAESLGPVIPPVKPKRKGSTAVFPDSY